MVGLQDRKPIRMLRVVFCSLYFDHQSRLDRDKVMKDAALMMEAGIGRIAPTKPGSRPFCGAHLHGKASMSYRTS
jgi:hypothetical protein